MVTETTKTDCFAYIEGKKVCAALRERYCDRSQCCFYKTQEKLDQELKRCEELEAMRR